jgi:hypothetical protein
MEDAKPPPPPRKRWKRVLLIGGISLGVLVVLALVIVPPVVASVAKSKIPEVLGPMLDADVTVGDVSFGWSGRLTVDELRIAPRGFPSPLAEVKRVDARVSLGAAIGGKYIAEVEVTAPKLVVERNAQGRFNYDPPPTPSSPEHAKPKEPSAPSEPPFVQAVLKVRDGEITVKGPGKDSVFRALSVDAKVDTLAKPVDYSVSLADPQGGTLRAEGSFDLEKKAGPLKVVLERLALENLAGAARAYGPDPAMELAGRLGGSLDYRLDGIPVFSGKTDLALEAPSVRFQGRRYEFDSVRLAHSGGLDEKGSGPNAVTLGLGPLLAVDLKADVTDAFGARVAKTSLSVNTELAAVEAFLKKSGLLPADLALAGSVALSGTIVSQGPTDADLRGPKLKLPVSWDMETRGKGIAVTLDKKRVDVGEIHHVHKGSIDAAGTAASTLSLRSGKVASAEIVSTVRDVFGKPAAVSRIDAKSDLGELGKMLEKLLELKEGMKLEGQASLKGTVEAQGADAARVDLDLSALDLVAVDKDGKRYELDKAIGLKAKASWDGKTSTAAAETVKLDSSFAKVDVKGGASFGKELKVQESLLTLDADLGKLAEKLKSFLEKPPALGGRAVLTAKGTTEKIAVDGTFTAVKFDTYGPLDATLKHEGAFDAKYSGRHTLRLDSGKALSLSVVADLKDAMADSRSASADLALSSDLGALSEALPGLVELKPGTGIAGAASVTGKVAVKGSSSASFDVDAKLVNLEAVEKATKKRQEVDKAVSLRARGTWDGTKKSVDLETFTLASAVATAEAKGGVTLTDPVAVRQSSILAKADLEKLGARLSLFIADPPGLAGTVDVKGSYAGETYDLNTTVKGVKITTKKAVKEGGKDVVKPSVIGPIDATVVQKGTFSAAKNGGLRIETCRIESAAVAAVVTGELKKVLEADRTGALQFTGTVKPVELTKWMPEFGLGGPPIELAASVALKPELIVASGKTELKGLLIKDAGTGATKVAMTKPVEFTVEVKGKDGDIAAKLKTALFEWVDQGYAAKGALDAEATYTAKGTAGTTRILNLEIVDGQKNKVVEPAVTLVHDVGMAPGSYEIRKLEIASGFLRGSLTGALKNLDTEPEFVKVRGAFRYHPDKLGAALKPWLPGTLAGAEEKTLDLGLDGKARSMDALSILRGATSTADLDLAKFTMTGTTVSGKAKLELKKGVLASGTPLDVNQGKTDLQASVDFNDKFLNPKSSVAFQAKDVDANANMGPLLENINPIFHTVNGTVDGKLTADFKLAWTGPIEPGPKGWDDKDWVAESKLKLTGQGFFAVKNLNVVGSPTVKDIMAALGEANAIQGELLGTQIQVANGRCEYQKMVLRMSRYQLVFSGWVDFGERDRQGNVRKKMEMMVEMPMTEHLRKKYPQLARYTGNSFFVPLKGTVDSPRLDFEAAIQELIKRAIPNLIEDKAKDLLDRLLDKKKK